MTCGVHLMLGGPVPRFVRATVLIPKRLRFNPEPLTHISSHGGVCSSSNNPALVQIIYTLFLPAMSFDTPPASAEFT